MARVDIYNSKRKLSTAFLATALLFAGCVMMVINSSINSLDFFIGLGLSLLILFSLRDELKKFSDKEVKISITPKSIMFTDSSPTPEPLCWDDIDKVSISSLFKFESIEVTLRDLAKFDHVTTCYVSVQNIAISTWRMKSFMNDMIAVPQAEREEIMRRYFGRAIIA